MLYGPRSDENGLRVKESKALRCRVWGIIVLMIWESIPVNSTHEPFGKVAAGLK